MQTDQEPEPYTHQGALWLNSIIWALLGLCVLRAFQLSGSYAALDPLMLTLPIAGLGILANLLLALWHFIQGRSRQAWQYLWSLLLLAVCLLGLLRLVFMNAPRKFGG
jgi:hypothetical protein